MSRRFISMLPAILSIVSMTYLFTSNISPSFPFPPSLVQVLVLEHHRSITLTEWVRGENMIGPNCKFQRTEIPSITAATAVSGIRWSERMRRVVSHGVWLKGVIESAGIETIFSLINYSSLDPKCIKRSLYSSSPHIHIKVHALW